MKSLIRLSLLLLIMSAALSAAAVPVKVGRYDALSQTALIEYLPGDEGYYYKKENQAVSSVEGDAVAFNPKTNTLYILTDAGLFAVVFDKVNAKTYKNNKQLLQLSNKDEAEFVSNKISAITNRFHDYNLQRRQIITDSINRAAEEAKIRQQQELERQRVEAKRQEALREAKRRAYECRRIPVMGMTLRCLYCDHSVSGEDVLEAVAVGGKKIYQIEKRKGALGTGYDVLHAYELTPELENSNLFEQHMNLYRDSLADTQYILDAEGVKNFNRTQGRAQIDRLRSIAPHGYLSGVSIDCVSNMKVSFTFTNTDKRTIKSISLVLDYLDAYDDYEHVVFTGNGPLHEFEEAHWDLRDNSASCPQSLGNMSVSLIINYSDGTMVMLEDEDVLIDNGE